MRGIALALSLGMMSVATAPGLAKADPQVLTAAQMDAVTAAGGIVHLNLPTFSVIVLNIPDIRVIANVDLGDIVVQNRNVVARSVITQVAVATTVGITVCGFCLGGSPQVVGTAIAIGGPVSWPGLR
jgi:hypothetical protein